MIFTEVGSRAHSTIILLHGGGLSDSSWKGVAEALVERYHVVTPVIGMAKMEERSCTVLRTRRTN